MIHIEPIVFTARLLPDGGKYGDSYTTVATIQKIGRMGYVSACKGKITRQVILDLGDELEKFGIDELKWLNSRKVM